MTKNEFMNIMVRADACYGAIKWLAERFSETPGDQVDLRSLAESCPQAHWLNWIAEKAFSRTVSSGKSWDSSYMFAADYRSKTRFSEKFDRAFWLASIPLEEAIERIKTAPTRYHSIGYAS
ncbi:hypothetical protein LCGC14_0479430 [marine sediment metagenome]|uniref:Uncharacterized protein n=1 Tax=marine sediment metagenome TaxID=412755 RepID=A0A0F9SSV2_9ZZZZ